MPVTVRFFSLLRAAAGTESVRIEAGTVSQAVLRLKALYRDNPDFIRLLSVSCAVLRGENVLFLQGAGTRLADGDELTFFPPIGGG